MPRELQPQLGTAFPDTKIFTSFRETQYRRWFRQWGIRKRTLAAEKNEIVAALGRRKNPETSTSNVNLNQGGCSKAVDTKQLKRYIKDTIRHQEVVTMAPGA